MFGIVHLIILLVRLISGASTAANTTTAPRSGSRIRTKGGVVTMECPFCGNLGVGTAYRLDEMTLVNGWQWIMDIYECPKCRRTMNTQAMQNDGTGVMTARTWDCPSCRSRNPAVRYDCTACGARVQ